MRNPLFAGLLAVLMSVAAAAEEVRIDHDGLVLNASLEEAGTWPEGPVVLLVHGTLAHRQMEIIRALQGMLADRGLASLAVNLSLGIDDRAAAMYDCAAPHTHRHDDAVDEIDAWVEWLRGQGVERIALLGHSRGGNQVARYAAADPDPAVSSVILVAPQTWDAESAAADYEKRYETPLAPVLEEAESLVAAGKGGQLMGPMGFIYCEDTEATAAAVTSYYAPDPALDTPTVIPDIEVPVLVYAGTADQVVDGLVEAVEPLADGERVRLEVLDGAGHFFRDLYSEDIADGVADLVEGG